MSAFLALLGCATAIPADTSDTQAVEETGSPDPDRARAICERWNTDRAALTEGTWSGSTATCDPGELSPDGRESTLRLINLYRAVAGLPPVTESADLRAGAQSCALMLQANGQLSHAPPTSWACYGGAGASSAGLSNLASAPAVMAIDMYMADFGNETTMGHRRWLLSNSLGPIGIGGASSFSCLQVIGGTGTLARPFVAWPPDGPMPIQAMNASFVPVDAAGWTVQSDTIDLSGRTVTVTRDGTDVLAVTAEPIASYYGSTYAIRIVPQGWVSEAGHSYRVQLADTQVDWTTQMVDCSVQ